MVEENSCPNKNSYEKHKGYIYKYRANNKQKYNDYMKVKVLEHYYHKRYGKTQQEIYDEKIVCDIHRLFKRSYVKKLVV